MANNITSGGEFIHIYNAVAVTANLVVGGAVNGVANSIKSNNIETFHIESTHPSCQVWIDSECAVNANNILFDNRITPTPSLGHNTCPGQW